MNYAKQRKSMVDNQLRARGITDKKILEAMEKIPREKFIPKTIRYLAYVDSPLSIGSGQTISQPYMVAVMSECLKLKGDEKVLEIGAGSGYQAAILGKIVKNVYTVERLENLANKAKETLEKLGYKNIEIIVGDGTLGYEKEAPYDVIIVTAGCYKIPQPLLDQLKDGGRLAIPIGDQLSQELYVITKKGEKLETKNFGGCRFVPLIGKEGWK